MLKAVKREEEEKKKSFWQPVIEDRNSYTDMLVTSLCTPIILNARRYFHKRLNIHSHILYDSYHMSPLIEVALSVRALNTSTALNLLKCASFSALTLLTSLLSFLNSFFPCTCPGASSSREREASRWKTSIVLAAEHSGSLGSVGGRRGLGRGVGSAELRRGRQVAGAAQWEDECGRMEGEVAK